jgi:DHA1 family tetracycline resistance protein-like MFS transporter
MAFGIGFIIAPAIGGLLGEVGTRAPFWVAAVLSLANFCYGLIVLPESLPKDKRAPFSWKRANPVASLSFLSHHPEVFALAGVLFLMQLAHMVYPSTFVLYADYRFAWGSDMVGYTLAIVGVLSAIIQGGLIGRRSRPGASAARCCSGWRWARSASRCTGWRPPATGSGRRCRSPPCGASRCRPRRR